MDDKFESRSGTKLQMLVASLREDIPISFHGLFVNRIAASIVMPRVLRYAIYRAAGMRLQSANIFYGAQFAARRVTLGQRTFVNTNVKFEDVAPIEIGDDCQIGMEVMFVTSHHDFRDGRISKVPEPRKIVVGDRCWIGARATILPGVEIASDCVIAAGAVVTRSVSEAGVYAGVPARKIRDLKPHN